MSDQSQQDSSHGRQPDVMPSLTGSTTGAGRIGRYQIIKTLGEGSFGKVKLAYHLATHARVALKIINRKTLAKSDMQGRVEREISYLRLLRHPHIIKLYDVIKSKDEIIMVIEFAGKELFDYIVQRGRMSEDEARRFFQQIISAVDYCHRHKIVHRDLKPENLLLDDNLNVKIADFGLSNIMTDGNFLKTSCGSPNYAAPEVISGKLYAGPEVDVWSCGVILYVMLCGRLPFDDEFIPNLFKKISQGVYTIPPDLSPGAKNLLKRMLVVNPLNRITVREIIQDPWFSVNLDPSLLPPDMREEQERKKEEEKEESINEPIDDSLVGALGRTMGYSKEQVYDALRHTNGDGSEIRDAYQLVKDNRLMGNAAVRQGEMDRYLVEDSSTEEARLKQQQYQQMLAQQQQQQQQQLIQQQQQQRQQQGRGHSSSFSRDNPPALTFDRMQLPSALDVGGHSTPHTTIAVLPTSLPAYHRANMIAYGPATMRKLNPISTKKSKTRWHFGIRSRSYPLDVMGEIYRALKNLGAEWAIPAEEDLWTIHVRWKCVLPNSAKRSGSGSGTGADDDDMADDDGDAEYRHNNTEIINEKRETIMSDNDVPMEEEDSSKSSNNNEEKTELMKMRIQLYQIEQNNYLVDFKFDGWEEPNPSPDAAAHKPQPLRRQSNASVHVPSSLQMSKPAGSAPTAATTASSAAARSAAANVCRDKSEFDTFSAYPFLHLATRLIMELAVNSQNQ
ncbi:uncharacterized protein SAPINGB_P003476 [Magnusiomyces paraingens]|uniref:Carbon catabolite-derepressing protein kinase n=1 Tax=Magnusiomyces paraingens TaxID=2606893 RepID=A0A5E8BX05_9ASCO|nr:uncharacterized protein SAPINGB_P003476 [Saprochaete ingens]VVT53245.1 unnamed protein product [Saprochaete ingens]